MPDVSAEERPSGAARPVPIRTGVGIATTDQLHQLLRHRAVSVGPTSLLGHRALGFADDDGFAVCGSLIADAKFGTGHESLDDRAMGGVAVAGTHVDFA